MKHNNHVARYIVAIILFAIACLFMYIGWQIYCTNPSGTVILQNMLPAIGIGFIFLATGVGVAIKEKWWDIIYDFIRSFYIWS